MILESRNDIAPIAAADPQGTRRRRRLCPWSPPLIGITEWRMHMLIDVIWKVGRESGIEIAPPLIVRHHVRMAERIVAHRPHEQLDEASGVA